MKQTQRVKLIGSNYEMNPFPHFAVEEVFTTMGADAVLRWLEYAIAWELTKTDFYTQYEFSLLEYDLPKEVKFLIQEGTIDAIISKLKEGFQVKGLELAGVTAHKLTDGHRIGIHNDYIGREETHRLIIQFSPGWKEENGGYLMLFNSSNANDVVKVIRPIHNTGLAFEISKGSFHAVSTINKYSRYTLVYTFK